MKRVAVIFCAVLAVAVAAEEAIETLKVLKVCNRGQSEDYNECLKDAIQDGVAKLSKGNPELNLSALDPYFVDYEEFEYGNEFARGKMSLKGVNVYGTSRISILNVKASNPEGRQNLEVLVGFPKILVEGEYKAEGHLGDFRIGGKGLFNVSMEGVKVLWDITGRIENDRWVIEHFQLVPEVEKLNVYFDDLFNGNDNINKAARNFINAYWPVFYKELVPYASAGWDRMMTELGNRIFSKLPYSKLFP